MRAQKSKSESGQILVLLAVGFVALLAFVALAIDGGAVFLDRRSAQNAADAAALAGAYEVARYTGVVDTAFISKVKAASLAIANINHYGTDYGKTFNVDYPPVLPSTIHLVKNATGVLDEIPNHYIRVTITSTVNTSFLHFVFPGLVKNTVEAVAHVIPSTLGPPYNGNALVALAPHECPSLTVGGNGNTILSGGGIFVNSDCKINAVDGGSGSFQINAPSMTVVGVISITHPGNIIVPSGALIQNATSAHVAYPPNNSTFPVPKCLTTANKIGTDNKTVNGITYDEWGPGSMTGFGTRNIYFDPGVYCITINKSGNGTAASINGGQYLYNDPLDLTRVLLVITGDDPCNLYINGGATLNLTSYNGFYNGVDYTGFLFYFDPRTWLPSTTNVGEKMLTLDGNSASSINGEIYAPTCSITYNGNSGNSYTGQVIGYDYTLVGGAEININFDAGKSPQIPQSAQIDLSQ
jgi:hypothetical protein